MYVFMYVKGAGGERFLNDRLAYTLFISLSSIIFYVKMGHAIRLFHKELEAYLSAEGTCFPGTVMEDGEARVSLRVVCKTECL